MFSRNATEFNVELAAMLESERGRTAEFLLALAEFDARRLWEELGYTSLFMYLHRELGLSKGTAYFKKTAAELVRDYPEIVEPLRDGRLCVTAVGELAKVITPENREAVVPRYFNCSRTEAREVSAALAPRADPPSREVVTPLPPIRVVQPVEPRSTLRGTPASAGPRPCASPVAGLPARALHDVPDPSLDAAVDPERILAFVLNRDPTSLPARTPDPPRDGVEPLTTSLFRLHLTVSRHVVEKLDAARDALSHAKPGATRADVVEAGLDLLLAERDRRKGLVKRPRASPPPSASDAIPAHVRRAVWRRDQGCCQWRLPSGEICGSRTRVQFDHAVPRARAGESTVENVRLLCAPHNRLAARLILGDACVDRHAPRKKGGARGAGS